MLKRIQIFTLFNETLHYLCLFRVLFHGLKRGNLEEFSAGPVLPPHLTALPSSQDTGAAHPPVHCGGAGHSPLPARFQTEALHHLGPAPHLC